MSLQKEQTLPSGVSYNFHKITELQYKENSATVVLSSFLNQEAKESGKDVITKTIFTLPIADKTNILKSAYLALTASATTNGELITPAVTEEVPETTNEAGEIVPAFTKEITPAVYEQIETNPFAGALEV